MMKYKSSSKFIIKNLELYKIQKALQHYIIQYHLTRYYDRIKEYANKQTKIQQNSNQNDYKKFFQPKLNIDYEENTKKKRNNLKIYSKDMKIFYLRVTIR
ncbi:unnamed protein product [Paramecium pentaurelia]|uniref:Uncharacterized protein n=1 Tax=Paramecium pentaurelia TaxID=43138 RepID=A0A8S1TW28_9CILI|nr:unnamed protein product [Paramecium pentaurelia]